MGWGRICVGNFINPCLEPEGAGAELLEEDVCGRGAVAREEGLQCPQFFRDV